MGFTVAGRFFTKQGIKSWLFLGEALFANFVPQALFHGLGVSRMRASTLAGFRMQGFRSWPVRCREALHGVLRSAFLHELQEFPNRQQSSTPARLQVSNNSIIVILVIMVILAIIQKLS